MNQLSELDRMRARIMATKKQKNLERIREELGIEPPKAHKVRKKRKPMTEEQKAKARDNLAKARAARGPAKTSSVHPDVLALPEDHPLSAEKVKSWLKYQTDKLKSIKQQRDAKESSLRMEYQVTENYVKNLKVYLKDNVWLDHRYGERGESKMDYVIVSPAGDNNE
jgi:hypothetical protein